MKSRTNTALLIAMLCIPCMLRAQTPFRQQCQGEGENNLANFVITNSLPEGLDNCQAEKCNPYFIAAQKIEGSCTVHQWTFDNVVDEERGFEFCKRFEPERSHIVKHSVTLTDDVTPRVYTTTCSFTPEACCDLKLSVELIKMAVLGQVENQKTCLVNVEEVFDKTSITSYSVETLEEVIYKGNSPQGTYRVPCGNRGDVICFTVKNTLLNCEQSKCIFLENLELPPTTPRIQANNNLKELNITCFPNPTSDLLNVSLFLPEGIQGNFQMMNVYGAVVYETPITSGYSTKEIETTAFPAGTYLVLARNGNQVATAQKVVLMKK